MDAFCDEGHDATDCRVNEGVRDAPAPRAAGLVTECCPQCEAESRKWNRFLRDRADLGDWLIDAATDSNGAVVTPRINAALGGEDCVPGEFSVAANGKRYHIALVSTSYEVTQVECY